MLLQPTQSTFTCLSLFCVETSSSQSSVGSIRSACLAPFDHNMSFRIIIKTSALNLTYWPSSLSILQSVPGTRSFACGIFFPLLHTVILLWFEIRFVVTRMLGLPASPLFFYSPLPQQALQMPTVESFGYGKTIKRPNISLGSSVFTFNCPLVIITN